MTLSNQQEMALSAIHSWWQRRPNQFFKLSGNAGTGKSFLIKYIVDKLKCRKPAFVAYTAKAALVLKDKGIEKAQTIHSLIYMVSVEVKGNKKIYHFKRRRNIDNDIIIVDEASMVDKKIHLDLLSYGKPVLYIGDHSQLPPISGNFSLMEESLVDYKLTEIHRQAYDNPIIRMSIDVRDGKHIGFHCNNHTRKIHKDDLTEQDLKDSQQIITGKNNTRIEINMLLRNIHQFNTEYPEVGDRIVICRNDYELGIFNGQQFIVTSNVSKSGKECFECEVVGLTFNMLDLLNRDRTTLRFHPSSFHIIGEIDEKKFERGDVAVADYGYAVSCHKAQGSEWDNVMLYDDRFGCWDVELRKRFLYTAITRAKDKLTWVI